MLDGTDFGAICSLVDVGGWPLRRQDPVEPPLGELYLARQTRATSEPPGSTKGQVREAPERGVSEAETPEGHGAIEVRHGSSRRSDPSCRGGAGPTPEWTHATTREPTRRADSRGDGVQGSDEGHGRTARSRGVRAGRTGMQARAAGWTVSGSSGSRVVRGTPRVQGIHPTHPAGRPRSPPRARARCLDVRTSPTPSKAEDEGTERAVRRSGVRRERHVLRGANPHG